MAVAISVCALAFTVGTFYWLNLWPGSLAARGQPSGYGFAESGATLLLRFPLAFYNSGANARVLLDLRLRVVLDGTETVLPWRTTRSTLKPQPEDVIDFPKPFAVPGRAAVTVVLEFGLNKPTTKMPNDDYELRLDARDSRREDWHEIGVVRLGMEIPDSQRAAYIAYGNTAI